MESPQLSQPEGLVSDPAPRRSWIWALWLAGIILVIYPLSIGPAARLYYSKLLSEQQLKLIYAPIGYLAERSSLVQQFLRWYIEDLWHARPRSAPVVAPPPNFREF